jgi:hypothetical protein
MAFSPSSFEKRRFQKTPIFSGLSTPKMAVHPCTARSWQKMRVLQQAASTPPALDSGRADSSRGANMLHVDTIANHVIDRSRTADQIVSCAQAGFGKKAGTQATLNVVSMTQVPT